MAPFAHFESHKDTFQNPELDFSLIMLLCVLFRLHIVNACAAEGCPVEFMDGELVTNTDCLAFCISTRDSWASALPVAGIIRVGLVTSLCMGVVATTSLFHGDAEGWTDPTSRPSVLPTLVRGLPKISTFRFDK
jgi:hypothetical protein